MPIPNNKLDLLHAITDSYTKLKKDLIDIPDKDSTVLELPGHAKSTTMNVSNLVAYLIGWGELVLKWNAQIEQNIPVDFPETDYKWTELGRLAQKFYTDYEDETYPDLLKKLDVTVQEILTLIETTSNQKLYQSTWYKSYSMGRMIQLNTASPYKNARARVRKWKKSKKNM